MFLTEWWESIKHLFDGLKSSEEEILRLAIKTTDALVGYDQANPGAVDLITGLIPGDADDYFVRVVRDELPKILIDLRLVDQTLHSAGATEVILNAQQTLSTIAGDTKNAFLHSISSLLARAAAPETTWSKVVVAIEGLVKSLHGS